MLPIHAILQPTDFSQHSEYAHEVACALAHDYGARLMILHVAPTMMVYGQGVIPPDPEVVSQEAQAQLERLKAPNDSVQVKRRLEKGDPATEIVGVAEEIGADLIVMGTHGRTGLSRLLMGSVAEQVMRKACCPVLTVKAPFPALADESTPVEGTGVVPTAATGPTAFDV